MENFEELIVLLQKWSYLGKKELSNGVVLIAHVPHVAPEAWLHEIYPGLNESQIKSLEQNLSIIFTDDFRNFLSHSNGINIFSDILSVFGLRASYERQGDKARQPYDLVSLNKERPKKCPKDFLWIGAYSWDGSKVYIDCSSGKTRKVYRCERYNLNVLQDWPDIWSWLIDETNRIEMLLDENGKRKNPKIPTV